MSEEDDAFRSEIREWISANFPASLVGKSYVGKERGESDCNVADLELWRTRLASKGWGAPTWPVQYGGAGLTPAEARVLQQELTAARAFNPIPLMTGMGISMIGPTLLDYGTNDQKARHLPGIASGEVCWCLGLSEPNAGSDLASLAMRADDQGDHFILNGQKVWTSGAHLSQWCGALVRTDVSASKRNGLSFVLLSMDQPDVQTRPIRMISGASPFCETYFNDARAEKSDLLGALNDGWNVVKRLLEYERQSQGSAEGVARPQTVPLQDIAKEYVGVNPDGSLADSDLRARLVNHLMEAKAHELTTARVVAESRGQARVSPVVSILKNSATAVSQARMELLVEMMGSQGIGWEGDSYSEHELNTVRDWLLGKATSIYGGSFEIQNNIISKNILGLPETTQKG